MLLWTVPPMFFSFKDYRAHHSRFWSWNRPGAWMLHWNRVQCWNTTTSEESSEVEILTRNLEEICTLHQFFFQHQLYQGRFSWNRLLWEFNYKYVPGKPRHKLGMEKGGAFRNLESQVWWVVIFRRSAFHLLPLRRATRWIWCQSCLHHCCHGNVRLSQDVRSYILLCVVIF